jgi:hypothetical protein
MRWYAGGGDGGDDDDDEGGGSSARCRIVAALPLLLEFSLVIVIDDSVDEAEASMACGEARNVIIITRGAVNENLKAFVMSFVRAFARELFQHKVRTNTREKLDRQI